ncbi:MAG TPA: polyphosphate kinase 2 family protein [Blastocatellia bacterium]|nr:polyphosphate kinase 2 family protein [Blastocatellia bacterium]
MNHKDLVVPPGTKVSLNDYDPAFTGAFEQEADSTIKLVEDIKKLAHYQNILYAQDSHALLIIFQAMDAAGKDGTIKHVMSGVNPQGCQVISFKAPSSAELNHDYLWRSAKALPERGRIGIFNRSYYEEVLVVRVHPELLDAQKLPPESRSEHIWKHRYEQINSFEKYLVENGISILKFYLNISKAEQKRRFLARIERPEKNWKFTTNDVRERACWDAYMEAYESMFNHTSTEWAPWYVIPANHKWFTRIAVADIILDKLKSLNLAYPVPPGDHKERLLEARRILESEE